VLETADGTSSLAVSLSSTMELLEGHIDAVTINRVCWGTQSALAVALLHFLEIGTELELHGFRRNADLKEDQVDAL
jgi:hypothetical protein